MQGAHDCHGSQINGPSVATQFENNACVAVLGLAASPLWSLIDPNNPDAGVQVEFGGGEACLPDAAERSVVMKVQCDRTLSETVSLTAEEPQTCRYEMNFKGPDGCPGGSGGDALGGGWTFVAMVFVCFCLYCGLGTLYNVRYHNLKGMEAIPNNGFWVELPSLVKTGCLYSYEKFNEMKAKYYGRNGYTNPDFDDDIAGDDAY